MVKKLTKKLFQYVYRRLPLAMSGAVIVASIAIWLALLDESAIPFATSLKSALPWIVLIMGISFAILFIISIRLAQLTRERSHSLKLIRHDIKKEILERNRAEESKQKLEKALLQGQKLQAIGTLAGGVAHDFNNLLYAITGYVEMAREDVDPNTVVYKNLGKVLEATHRGQEMIARILAFSRRQQHAFKPIDLQKTIESILSLLRPTIPASVTIHFTTPSKNYMVLGDQTRIHQVVVNIINNAVDAMDGEGTITLSIVSITADNPIFAQLPNIIHEKYCKISIKDTGHGMDINTQSRIFEPFFTTKEVGKGTGLGLATAHTIIKEHHGEIVVNSQPGYGTTFTLLIPEYTHKESHHGKHTIS